jgi:hypothetical protein
MHQMNQYPMRISRGGALSPFSPFLQNQGDAIYVGRLFADFFKAFIKFFIFFSLIFAPLLIQTCFLMSEFGIMNKRVALRKLI